jgi:hypothetical protein
LGEGQEVEIPPSGQQARVLPRQVRTGEVNGIPIVRTEFGEVEGLPEPEENTVYIVSTLVLQALKGSRADVVSPDTSPTSAVRDANGKIIGVRGFQIL